jgi:thiol-disulfide isomerase/thioredoxin
MLVLVVAAACAPARPERAGDARADGGSGLGRLATPFPIEPFEAVDLDGRAFSLSAWKGHVVVINIWATWCPPCRRELPALAALQERHRDRLRVLGLLDDTVTAEFAREFARSARISYPIVRSTFDIEQRLPTVPAIPTTFLLDRSGRLVATGVGELDPAELEREVLRLLG